MKLPQDAYLVFYTDDIAAIIITRDVVHVHRELDEVMRKVISWMRKTDIVLLSRQTIPIQLVMKVGTDSIVTNKAVKYLGLYLDCKLSYWEQI